MTEVAAFLLGAVATAVGFAAFAAPALRQIQTEKVELRRANRRLSDRLTHASQGKVEAEWLESGVKEIRRGTTIPDDAVPTQVDDWSGDVQTTTDGTRIIKFDDIRDGGYR